MTGELEQARYHHTAKTPRKHHPKHHHKHHHGAGSKHHHHHPRHGKHPHNGTTHYLQTGAAAAVPAGVSKQPAPAAGRSPYAGWAKGGHP